MSRSESTPRSGAIARTHALSELVSDILEATGLVPADRLAIARGRAGRGSLAQALVDEGLASREGVARAIADRYHLPYVDIVEEHPSPDAVEQIPAAVLERTCAIPYRYAQGVLKVAIADPANIAAIDELRLATRHTVELAVAQREDILVEIKRFSRASDSIGSRTQADIEELEFLDEQSEEDDLEVDDGVSDAPLVRLVNSLIYQAAEDGASDVHVEPQEDACSSGSGSTACSRRCSESRSVWRTALRRDSRFWPSSTSPSAESRRTGGSRSLPPPPAAPSTSASRRSRPSKASRSSCACSTSRSVRRRSRSSASPKRCERNSAKSCGGRPGHSS